MKSPNHENQSQPEEKIRSGIPERNGFGIVKVSDILKLRLLRARQLNAAYGRNEFGVDIVYVSNEHYDIVAKHWDNFPVRPQLKSFSGHKP